MRQEEEGRTVYVVAGPRPTSDQDPSATPFTAEDLARALGAGEPVAPQALGNALAARAMRVFVTSVFAGDTDAIRAVLATASAAGASAYLVLSDRVDPRLHH